MTESDFTLSDKCRQRLDNYLDAIELALLQTTAPRESRRSVVEMVEGQVVEMCRTKLGDEATDEEIGRLFDKLDPPSLYAEEFDRHPEKKVVRSVLGLAAPINRLALASFVLLALPLPLGLIGVAFNSEMLVALFFASVAVAFFVSPVLSFIAIRQISQTKQMGRQLAMISLYAAPIVAANMMAMLAPTVMEDLLVIICVCFTLLAMNVGVIWLIRYTVEKALPKHFHSESRTSDPPIVVNSVASA